MQSAAGMFQAFTKAVGCVAALIAIYKFVRDERERHQKNRPHDGDGADTDDD